MKENATRNRLAVIGLRTMLAMGLLLFVGLLAQYILIQKSLNSPYPEATALQKVQEALIPVLGILGIIYCVFLAGQIVIFMLWHLRCYLNLKRTGWRMRYWEGWTILSWFLPMANFVMPGLVLVDTARQYARMLELLYENHDTSAANTTKSYAQGWWGLLVAQGIFNFLLSPTLMEEGKVWGVTFVLGISLLLMNFCLLMFTRRMGKAEAQVYQLWVGGVIEEYKYSQMEEGGEGAADAWYGKEVEEYEPEMEVYVDQKKEENGK